MNEQQTEQGIYFSMNPEATPADFKEYLLQRIELAKAWIKNGNNPESNQRWIQNTETFLKENPEDYMENLQTRYFNGTSTEVNLKTKNGEIITVKPYTGATSKKGDPYVKIKYINTGWRKY